MRSHIGSTVWFFFMWKEETFTLLYWSTNRCHCGRATVMPLFFGGTMVAISCNHLSFGAVAFLALASLLVFFCLALAMAHASHVAILPFL